jgi:hypothetical protein
MISVIAESELAALHDSISGRAIRTLFRFLQPSPLSSTLPQVANGLFSYVSIVLRNHGNVNMIAILLSSAFITGLEPSVAALKRGVVPQRD